MLNIEGTLHYSTFVIQYSLFRYLGSKVTGVIKCNQHNACQYTVIPEKFKTLFLQESDERFNGQHSYNKSDNITD